VSAGLAEGIARVVQDVSGFGKLKQGDILVTRSTTAAFNVVLPLLAGIVTDRGGTLSHSAIVAREYGIPAVVGSREATRLIPDGARIRVDGTLGEAVIL
jgi:pyruvate,water dikinase